MYEFLPAIGSIVAIVVGLKKLFGKNQTEAESESVLSSSSEPESNFGIFFGLLVWWVVTSIAALTLAGERMPWLTYHMAWPMILLAGWGIGQIIESVIARLAENKSQQNALAILIVVVFALAVFNVVRSL